MKTARTAALIGIILGGALVIQAVPAYAFLPTVGCCQYSDPSSCVGGITHNNCPGTGGIFLPQYSCFQDSCVPAFAKPAKKYTAWFARAMDECSPGTVTVLSPGVPSSGCIQANVTTDSALQMNYARLGITSAPKATGRLKLIGRGFQAGARIKVQLTVRVTKSGQSTIGGPPGGVPITFPDATVQCPNTPTGFVASPFGNVAGLMNLSDCLPAGLSNGNIEILDAALINVDNGLVFARPGIELHVVAGNP